MLQSTTVDNNNGTVKPLPDNERWSKLYIVPLVQSLVFPIAFSAIYTIAVLEGHVEPIFPYVSDAGATPPESCLFTFALNLFCSLGAISIYLNYQQVEILLRTTRYPILRSLNWSCLWLGLISTFSMNLAGICQSTTMLVTHLVCASIGFIAITFYMWIQVIFDYSLGPEYVTRTIANLRTSLIVIGSVAEVITMVSLVFSLKEFKGNFRKDRLKWSPEDGGYEMHVVSAVGEWIHIFIIALWVGTFTKQIRLLQLERPKVTISGQEAEQHFKNGTSFSDQKPQQ